MNQRRQTIWVIALLCALTWMAFWPALFNGFVRYDDPQYIIENPHVLTGLNPPNVRWAFQAGYASNWHPVTWLSHMLDVEIFGVSAGCHHLVNLVFHTANTVLLFLAFQFLTGATWRSALVAALFAVHPLHVESVAWLSERKDLLSTFFLLWMIWAYGMYTKSEGGRSSRWYGCALVLFALGLMSKPMLVTVPFVLLLLDYWPLNRLSPKSKVQSPKLSAKDSGHEFRTPHSALRTGEGPQSTVHGPQSSNYHDEPEFGAPSILRSSPATEDGHSVLTRLLLEKLPFFCLAGVSGVLTFIAQQKGGSVSLLLPLGPRVANAIASYLKYLGKMVWPANLSVFYPHPDTQYPISHQWPTGLILAAAVFLVAVSLAAVFWRKRLPWFPVGWFWFLGTLVPVIGIVQVGAQAMADRYTYIPLIGIFICVVWGAAEMLEWAGGIKEGIQASPRLLSNASIAIAAAILVACVGLTQRQTRYWRDERTLFSHALEVAPGNAIAHDHLGIQAGEHGGYTQAIEHFQAALKADPSCGEANYGLAYTYQLLGRTNDALQEYQAAVKVRPGSALIHARFASLLWQTGRRPEALEQYEQALRFNPEDIETLCRFGSALAEAGESERAAPVLRKAVRLSPDHAEALKRLAEVDFRQGNLDEAEGCYRRLARLFPAAADPHINLGGILWRRGARADALAEYAEAVRVEPNHAVAQYNLGFALASAGSYSEADLHFAEATRLQPEYAEAFSARGHELIRQGKPEEAAAQLRQALRLKPDAQTFSALGLAQKAVGQTKDAVASFREALKLNPDYVPALAELAWMLSTSTEAEIRNGIEAVQHAERAQTLSGGQDLRVLTSLDAAYAEAGRFTDAAKAATQVRDLAKVAGDLQAGQSATERLALYEKQQPFRAPTR